MRDSNMSGASLRSRATYLALYALLTAYPLYRIWEGINLLPYPFKAASAAAAALVPIGIYYCRSEFVVTYYVLMTAVLQASRIDVFTPAEALIYSLILLHADLIGKALRRGGLGGQVRVGVKGAVSTAALIAGLALTYLVVGYFTAYVGVGLLNAAVSSNGLTQVVLGSFLTTRAGSIILVVFFTTFTAYVITRYFGEPLSEALGMSGQYASAASRAVRRAELRGLIEGKAWYVKLMRYSSLTFIAFLTWFLIYPAIDAVLGVLPLTAYLRQGVRSGIFGIVSLGIALAATYLIYRLVKAGFASVLIPGKVSGVRLGGASVLAVAIPAALLTFYVVYLYSAVGASGFEEVLMKSLGFLKGSATPYGEVGWLSGLPGRVSDYFSNAVAAFKELTYLVKALITILWG